MVWSHRLKLALSGGFPSNKVRRGRSPCPILPQGLNDRDIRRVGVLRKETGLGD